MNAVKAAEMLRLALFSVAKTIGLVFTAALALPLLDPTVEDIGIFEMAIEDLALLMDVPAGPFF